MKIGITGGAGFIGGHVAEECLRQGHTPVIFDRRGHTPSGVTQSVEIFLGDVTDATAVTELAARVDGIIHLAACLGTQETIKNPLPSATTNILGSLHFLQACAQYDIPGTYIAVGNWWMDNSYSISKHTVERYIRMFNKERGTRVNQVRAVNAYGPRQSVAPPFGPAKVRKITPAFVCRALTGQQLEVYGDGEQISDMVHVTDVARALIAALLAAKKGDVFPDAFGVGPFPKDSLTVNEIATMISHVVYSLGGPLPQPLKHVPMRPGEVPGDRVSVDPDDLIKIGIDPEYLIPFHIGIRETIQWFIANWLDGFQAYDDDMETADTLVPATG